MDIKSIIREDLWTSIESTYETENYTHAISAGIIHLSNILREKGDAEGVDGVELVNETLSPKNPKIKINKLQTKTDKAIQEGFYYLIRGLYQAIRDPRSHESHLELNDTKLTADSILLFINFILENIEQAKGSFVLEDLKKHVFDKDFYYQNIYANLLVKTIPDKKRFDTLIEIYRDKLQGDIYKVSLFIQNLLMQLPDDEQDEFFSIISDELMESSDEKVIRYNLRLIPNNNWNKIKELPRLRIEGKIISDVGEGSVDYEGITTGALATWAGRHMKHFTLINNLRSAFEKKIRSNNRDEELYILKFFLDVITEIFQHDVSINMFVNKLSRRIIDDYDQTFEELLIKNISNLPLNWQEKFQNAFKNEDSGNHSIVFLPNGSTLFPIEEDEIPF